MRKFEKISFKEFKKAINLDKAIYNSYNLPVRKTKNSAGYDFELIEDLLLNPGENKIIPTGIKVKMNNDEMLMIVIRSSIGFKYNVRLTNQIGIIESDYYNNEENEGHLKISVQNHGNEIFKLEKGKSIAQGIIVKFLTTDNEKPINHYRKGGFGSTDKM